MCPAAKLNILSSKLGVVIEEKIKIRLVVNGRPLNNNFCYTRREEQENIFKIKQIFFSTHALVKIIGF